MTRSLLLFFAILIGLSSFGQYTEVINPNRPGFSKSSYSVGTGVYQIEAGLFYQNNKRPVLFTTNKSFGTDLTFRAGLFLEKLEFSANFKLQKDQILNNVTTGETYARGGISQFIVGAKYLFYKPTYTDKSKEVRSWKRRTSYDWKRLIPAIGVYVGLNTNLLSSGYQVASLGPRAALLLQNNFTQWITLTTNIFGENLILTERSYGYVTTLSYAVSPTFSIFGEHKGEYFKDTKAYQIGGGFTYLVNKDLQVGVNTHTDFHLDYLNLYVGLGASWRLDKHVDKELQKKRKKVDSKFKKHKKRGFFSRLFHRNKRRGRAPKAKKIRRKKSKLL